ncbi:MAG: SDR family NAD(P)-dependent oxidoreductase [Polyangiaceae bacterium]|nr:SDR family NAD(P)-dependent oxidoreductase [Polyangiaceae bacterium]
MSGSQDIVVVTGAAGFVGRHLVRLLAEGGARVRATDRAPEDRAFFGPLGVEYVAADLTDPASLRRVFEGSLDRVFHLGAICNFTTPYDRLRPVNVEGARRVAALSRRAGVRRFVHMSSTAVYGRYRGRPFTEEAARAPADDYGRSKRDGEDEVFAEMRAGLPVTVLRPCTIYGPGCTDGAGKVFSRRSAIGAIPGSGRQALSTVRVEDVAAAAEHLSRRPEANGQVYNLVDGSPPTLEEALALAAEVFGSPRPRARVPLAAVQAAARGAALAGRLTGRVPDLEPDAVKYLERDYIVDGDKLASAGFVARYPDFAGSMRAMRARQVVVITGLAQGMGREVARALARGGDTIAGFDIDEAGIASLRGELEGTGDHHLICLDTTDRAGILRFRDEVLARYGRVDTVLSNVGVGFFGPFEEIDLGRALRCLEIDVIGTAAVFQAFIPSMRERRAGKLVAMSSLVGQIPFPFESIYTAAKFAVEGLVQSIRYELQPFGVKVALIAPAQVSTTFAAKIHALPPEGSPYRERVARFIRRDGELIKTAPTPQQAAEVICRVVRSADPPLHTQLDAMSTFFLGLNRALPVRLRDLILVRYMDIG